MTNTQTAAITRDLHNAEKLNWQLAEHRDQLVAERDALAAENARLREALTALYQNIEAISNIGWDDATTAAIEQARAALGVG